MTDKDKTIDFWKQQLAHNERWAIQGLLRIYQQQTSMERQEGVTKDANGVGFTAYDAAILTDLAKFYLKNGRLTKKQLQKVVFRAMPKYAGQLYRLKEEREGAIRQSRAQQAYENAGAFS